MKFLVIGSVTVDLFVAGINSLPQMDGDEFTNTSLAFTDFPLKMTVGGNGANTAYVLASLGADVALGGAVGDDELGRTMEQWLTKIGVDLTVLFRDPQHGTSSTIAINDQMLNRLSFHHTGPGPHYTASRIPIDLIKQTDVLLISGPTLLNAFRNEGYLTVLKHAKQAGSITAMDIGPMLNEPISLSEVELLSPHLDYLITNEHELRTVTNRDDLDAAIERMLEIGVRTVVLKLGSAGCMVITPSERYAVSGFEAQPTVTVGAGDSFNAGFLFAVAQEQDLASAARFGNATAALVLRVGTVLEAPRQADVIDLIKREGML